ncbi:hypothetical protein F5050DRAFT_1712371 [Lentinula boryana]|uniref:Proteophosphoglycan ppg4 n=1 Tax=Lentinula boryana TaxID=40481 RepID=A0ABQ8QCC4_9AGAR|nr:hypothetical protein F5050DRAFT_1712371 [Lentinula boryana]
MSVTFSLSEFTELVSTALEIDTSLHSELSTLAAFPPSPTSPPSYSTANAKPFPSLPLTFKSSASSPRVLRKIKSFLTYGNSRFNQSASPPLPTSRSEPLTANSEPSSPLKPIPTISLLNQKAQLRSDVAVFVPYLPLADRHERFGNNASIFSRHGSDCGSSITPPRETSDSGHFTFSKLLPTPPRSPTRRRASFSSSGSYSQDTESAASCSNLVRVSASNTTIKSKHSSLSSYDTSSSFQNQTDLSSNSSIQSHTLGTSNLDPFAKGRVQVVTRRTSAGSSYGSSSVYSSNLIHPFSSSHPAQSTLPVHADSSHAAEEHHHSLSSSALTSTSSKRRKRISPPKQKPAPTYPLPLPPRSKPPTGPLPPIPIDTLCSSFAGSDGLPSPPITPPASVHEASVLSTRQSERDWTLGLPYTSDEDIHDLRRITHGAGLSRRKEVMPRRKSSRLAINEVRSLLSVSSRFSYSTQESFTLPRTQESTQLLSSARRRTNLKPMGHKRKGSPFPLTLAPLDSGLSPSATPDLLRVSSVTTTPASSVSSSLFSSYSDTSDDPFKNAHRHRQMMAREPAGMILGRQGFPVPLSTAPVAAPIISDLGLDEDIDIDIETPMQSPTTPTFGRFAIPQAQVSVLRDRNTVSPSLQTKTDGSRKPVLESVVMLSLDPFETSDSESLISGEETTYWSARSSIDSINDSLEW